MKSSTPLVRIRLSLKIFHWSTRFETITLKLVDSASVAPLKFRSRPESNNSIALPDSMAASPISPRRAMPARAASSRKILNTGSPVVEMSRSSRVTSFPDAAICWKFSTRRARIS